MVKFSLRTPSGIGIGCSPDDNVDVLIDLDDGRVFAATFFTVKNLQTLMKRFRDSGECAHGAYVWAVDMVVVELISQEVVETVVGDLIASGEINSCCTRLQ